jgi:hypothetical protein
MISIYRYRKKNLYFLEVGENLADVERGVDVGIDLRDLAFGVDEVGSAEDTEEQFAHKFLFSPGAILLDHTVVRIGQEGEVELVLSSEFAVARDGIFGNAEDDDTELLQFTEGIPEIAGLSSAAGSIVFRIEIEDDPLAEIIVKGMGLTVLIQ